MYGILHFLKSQKSVLKLNKNKTKMAVENLRNVMENKLVVLDTYLF